MGEPSFIFCGQADKKSVTKVQTIFVLKSALKMAVNHLRIVATRGLSTSAVSRQLVQPPIQVYGIEGRYATALYSAATKKKALDTVEKDLKTFQATLKKDSRLADFLADPSIKKSLKADGLAGALAENGRFNLAESVAAAFATIMAAHRGEVVCEITTAKVLDAAMKKEVDGAIASFLVKGQKSLISYKVDATAIGGMIVSIGDKYVDMSIASKLNKYSDLINAAA